MSKLKKNSGSSLIQVLLSMALMLVAALSIAQLLNSFNTSIRGTTQKIEINDYKNLIQNLMLDPNNCQCHLNQPDLDFNSLKNTDKRSVQLSAINLGCGPGAQPLLKVGEVLSSGLVVSDISFSNIEPIAGSTSWKGVWTVNFDSKILQRKPLVIGQIVTVDKSIPAAAKIINCNAYAEPLPSPTPAPTATPTTCYTDRLPLCAGQIVSVDDNCTGDGNNCDGGGAWPYYPGKTVAEVCASGKATFVSWRCRSDCKKKNWKCD